MGESNSKPVLHCQVVIEEEKQGGDQDGVLGN
jgi:hypothetical protein